MESRTNFFMSPQNCSSFQRILAIAIIVSIMAQSALSQSTNLPCYSIAKQDGKSDELHEYNPVNKVWKNLGFTETYNIESIAVDYANSIIYTVNKGTFGKINPITARFKPIKELGSAMGVYGSITMNDITAITFDEINGIIYGVHRNGMNNSLLFKLNPTNGNILTNEFFDDAGNSVDYAKIESIPFGSPNVVMVSEIADIALDKDALVLCAVYKEDNARVLADLNLSDGSIESQTTVIYKQIESIGFDRTNNLKATTSSIPNLNYFSSLYNVNINTFDTQLIEEINNNFNQNFVCIDCAKKIQEIQNCVSDIINITDFTPEAEVYQAATNINSNVKVNQKTDYKATGYINLDNYFEVDANVNFSATIQENCGN